MENTRFKISRYACAVLLIVSSIALVSYQVVHINDVANGLLYYVAQSFLLAGSIFGLAPYVNLNTNRPMNNNVSNTRLSAHFMLSEFLNLVKHPDNIPTMQHVANLCYGCRHPSQGSCAVPALSRLPPHLRLHRPAADRLHLAPRLLEPLRPAPPLRPDRVLQVTRIPANH